MQIDEENVRQAIEMSQSSFPQVTGGLRIFLLAIVIAFLGLGIIILLFPSLDKTNHVLTMNPVANTIVKVVVWALLIFVVLGIVCIFSKQARLTSAILFAVYLLGYGLLAEVNYLYTRIDYRCHLNNAPVQRNCVVVLRKAAHNGTIFRGEELDNFDQDEEYYQTTFYLTVRFTDNNSEYEFQSTNKPLPFFQTMKEGNAYTLHIIRGTAKLQYVTAVTE